MSLDPTILVKITALVFAVVAHEAAHGWMADKCGDPTARIAGRITLNPIPHIDLFGSILLPFILIMTNAPFVIGSAKPVPINPYNMYKPKRDTAFVGAMGPITNFSIAFISLLILKFYYKFATFSIAGIEILLIESFKINVILAAFNLIPIPPLDGSRIVSSLLPDDLSNKYNMIEPYGFFIIIFLVMSNLLDFIFYPILNMINYLLHTIIF